MDTVWSLFYKIMEPPSIMNVITRFDIDGLVDGLPTVHVNKNRLREHLLKRMPPAVHRSRAFRDKYTAKLSFICGNIDCMSRITQKLSIGTSVTCKGCHMMRYCSEQCRENDSKQHCHPVIGQCKGSGSLRIKQLYPRLVEDIDAYYGNGEWSIVRSNEATIKYNGTFGHTRVTDRMEWIMSWPPVDAEPDKIPTRELLWLALLAMQQQLQVATTRCCVVNAQDGMIRCFACRGSTTLKAKTVEDMRFSLNPDQINQLRNLVHTSIPETGDATYCHLSEEHHTQYDPMAISVMQGGEENDDVTKFLVRSYVFGIDKHGRIHMWFIPVCSAACGSAVALPVIARIELILGQSLMSGMLQTLSSFLNGQFNYHLT